MSKTINVKAKPSKRLKRLMYELDPHGVTSMTKEDFARIYSEKLGIPIQEATKAVDMHFEIFNILLLHDRLDLAMFYFTGKTKGETK